MSQQDPIEAAKVKKPPPPKAKAAPAEPEPAPEAAPAPAAAMWRVKVGKNISLHGCVTWLPAGEVVDAAAAAILRSRGVELEPA